ncbi:flagellar hook-length control protein FliK [Geomicrobium sp. JCM 19039]|uniref:flagellar hook-length control protein FliK n=1 Tax=Geomicrobium sp. JCM 19039 TaxID=1460636 RepID=UPI00045F2908|nr:flagellar hook-length control protein FliK [Geomicrobium sp. JCM 19039]GAK10925.1 flagellar hook-length control protein FliK [Geomicrobium sp. JCM 19039]
MNRLITTGFSSLFTDKLFPEKDSLKPVFAQGTKDNSSAPAFAQLLETLNRTREEEISDTDTQEETVLDTLLLRIAEWLTSREDEPGERSQQVQVEVVEARNELETERVHEETDLRLAHIESLIQDLVHEPSLREIASSLQKVQVAIDTLRRQDISSTEQLGRLQTLVQRIIDQQTTSSPVFKEPTVKKIEAVIERVERLETDQKRSQPIERPAPVLLDDRFMNSASRVEFTPYYAMRALGAGEQLQIHIGTEDTKHRQEVQFQRQLHFVLNRAQFQHVGGKETLTIRLHPEHLGKLHIELVRTNGVMEARLLTASATARELIETQLPQLRNAFHQQHIQVERVTVDDIEQKLDGEQAERDREDDETAQYEEPVSDEQTDFPSFQEWLAQTIEKEEEESKTL